MRTSHVLVRARGARTEMKRLSSIRSRAFFFLLITPALKIGLMPRYGCGDGDGCAVGSRRKVGGAGLFGSGFGVPSGLVAAGSSGVG